jgi:hypothetical protein
MSSKVGTIVAGLFSGVFAEAAESKLEDVLQELHDKDKDEYLAVVHAGRVLVKKLAPVVEKSGTKIDDALLKALGEAIADSAEKNGVEAEG